MNYFRIGLLSIIGLFFFITGAVKLLDPLAFAKAIEGYRLISGWPAVLMALWIPWAECVLAVSLILDRFRKRALIAILSLIVVFQLALASAYLRGLDISCGCFGAENSSSVGFALLRNFALMAVILYLLRNLASSRAADAT